MSKDNKKENFKLSICMIVKNEEKYLDACLKSLQPLIDEKIAELIIVDTGSTDSTVEIANKYTEKVYFKEWNNNFSEARNYSISFAKGEYIFIMDADQEMEYSEVQKLITLFKGSGYKKYNTYSLVYKNFTDEELNDFTYFSLNLIFKNDGTFRYSGRVHNQPIYKEPVKNLEIYMLHYGYIMTDDVKERKFLRTATLLKEEIKNDPNNVYYIYQLSRSYEMHGDNNEAVMEVEKYMPLLEKQKMDKIYKINYYHNAATIYFNAKEYKKCIEYCEKMREIDKELIDSYYLLGKCNIIEGDIDEGVKNLHLYLKYHNSFRYEKYAKTNGLEVFSFGEKYKVITELVMIKSKFNQFDKIDSYVEFLMSDLEQFKLMLYEALRIFIQKSDIKMIDKIINKIGGNNDRVLLMYLLSKAILSCESKEVEGLMKLSNALSYSEKQELNNRIEKEKENPLENFMEFVEAAKEGENKVFKIENCLIPLIDMLNSSVVYDIVNSQYLDDIFYIVKFLLSKSDMLIHAYKVSEFEILGLFNKYEDIVKYLNEEKYSKDKEFVATIEKFRENIKCNNILEGVKYLRDAAILIEEFSSVITMFKDKVLFDMEKKETVVLNKDEIDVIVNNIKLLIDNNMINDATALYNQLEEVYNIKSNEELLVLKGILEFYNNNVNEAKNVFKKALKYYPESVDILCNIAYLYENEEKYLSAMKYYMDAKNINNEYIGLQEDIDRISKKIIVI